MKLSYSFHISNNKNAIKNKRQLSRTFNHNLRAYESKKYNQNINEILIGAKTSKDAFQDYKNFVNEFFKEDLEEYNSKQKRKDRIITDYISNLENKRTDIATEIIIQVGHKEFWEKYSLEERKKMTPIFQDQIKKFQNELPNFKIISAVVHYDESCPHIQIVGIPIKENCKTGLKKQINKTSMFTREKLEYLQDKLRENVLEQMQNIYGKEIDLKAKEKGRNKDLFIEDYIEMKKSMEEKIEIEYKSKLEKLDKTIEKKQEFIANNNIAKTNLEILEFIKNKKQKKKIQNSLFSSEEKDVYLAEDIENDLNFLSKSNYEVKVYQNSLNELKSENKVLNNEISYLKLQNESLKEENQKNNYIFTQLERIFPNIKNVLKTINSIVKEYSPWNKEQYEKAINKSLNIQGKKMEKERNSKW